MKKTSDFDWILGDWIRLNDEGTKRTYENWKRKDKNEYVGFSYTLKNKDTIWQEDAKLVKENGKWSLQITGKGEPTPTTFDLTFIGDKKFVCENAQNAFPQKIEYMKNGERLRAKISGGEMEIAFDFMISDH